MEKVNPEMNIEDFLIWLCEKHKVEDNGSLNDASFRFGNSIWIMGTQEDISKFAMTSKHVVNDLLNKLSSGGYIEYCGWSTYQLTDKGLRTIKEWKERPLPPSDYQDFVRIRRLL